MTPADLSAALTAVLRAAAGDGTLAVDVPGDVAVERPKAAGHGDYATSVALRLAKPNNRPPREIADLLADRIGQLQGIAKVEVAGPGFINIWLADDAQGAIARTVVEAGAAYGTNDAAAGERINLEFVSGNPTGPVHIGGTRWAAVGDALARLLQASGATVAREYYVNDAGAQIDRFAASLEAAARGQETPEGGYYGAYITDIATTIVARHPDALDRPDALEVFRADGLELMLAEIKASLESFGVHFDVYFSERTLHASGAVTHAIERLREGGHVYDSEGAVWLRTTDFGDDKDRVLVKSDGELTYFTADAAYYLNKRERGFDRVIIMLGADHHGYLGRMRAMAACFGDDPARTLELPIGQLVNLVKDGEPVRMSKRAGNVITLEDLVEAVGVDAARYSLARSSTDSMIDLDLDLLTRKSNDNPVFYVQYVHARISSILRNAAELGIARVDPAEVDVALLATPQERALLKALAEFPQIVASAAELREPHRVARYLEETVAPSYHRFYDACQVLPRGDDEVTALTHARLLVCDATRVVVANALALLGVSAPERM
ncbi:MAG: arginyl-tRNA synthetase [Frankiaceae bacterium]|nr:arginyl-tRNA synthetase [Frankiaceae bacterium]